MPSDLAPMGEKVSGASAIPISKGAPTGILKLDMLLRGGLRQNGITLLIGPPGEEKKLAALQFANSALVSKQPVVYVTTDVSPSELESTAGHYGLSLSGNPLLKFVDCYSWTLGSAPAGRNDIQVQGPSALNDLAIALAQALPESNQVAKPRVVLHSLSTLLLYNQPEVIFKFIQITGSRLKSSGATSLFLLESGMHDEKTVSTLRHLADEIIEIDFKGGKGKIRAPLSGVTEWLDFTVTGKGLELL